MLISDSALFIIYWSGRISDSSNCFTLVVFMDQVWFGWTASGRFASPRTPMNRMEGSLKASPTPMPPDCMERS